LVELFDKQGHSETRFIIGAEAQVLKGKPAFEFDKVELAKYLKIILNYAFQISSEYLDPVVKHIPIHDSAIIEIG